ncbi:hypothetical protein [Microbacterium thalassium]|uniref:Uncharacterized protein n=1 Tax=Microbacterium thalassium TaxID=362649 RepID=A0A7X0KVY5_9MICO|nr:hypothetical protein [Microbacterium thalassium]MBB6392717.1 hypothetical protein [Microbacterium thalassium]
MIRDSQSTPAFNRHSTAGRFKGREPSVEIAQLEAAWVEGPSVLYIGMAAPGKSGRRGLSKRLDEHRRHGQGEPVGHWGGRYGWQLADPESLMVCWKPTPDGDPATLETEMIINFVADFGQLPFANLRH